MTTRTPQWNPITTKRTSVDAQEIQTIIDRYEVERQRFLDQAQHYTELASKTDEYVFKGAAARNAGQANILADILGELRALTR